MADSTKASPIYTKRTVLDVAGCRADIAIMEFEDKLMVVVTHLAKLGTLVSVHRDSAGPDDASATYRTRVLLGKDEPDVHVAARYIAEKLTSTKPILLGISLRNLEVATVRAAAEAVSQLASKPRTTAA